MAPMENTTGGMFIHGTTQRRYMAPMENTAGGMFIHGTTQPELMKQYNVEPKENIWEFTNMNPTTSNFHAAIKWLKLNAPLRTAPLHLK
jgi:hypothetical protein